MDWLVANASNLTARLAQAPGLMAIAFLGAGAIGWNAYQDWQLSETKTTIAQTITPTRISTEPILITQLVEAHFFGQRDQKTDKAASTKPVDTPETRLRLKLHGVFAHSNHEQSRALIAEQDKSAKYYRLGDSLPGGATLDAVSGEYVTLNRGGVLETLSFKANRNESGASLAGKSNRNTPANRTAPSTQNAELASQQNTDSIRERLKRLRKAKEL